MKLELEYLLALGELLKDSFDIELRPLDTLRLNVGDATGGRVEVWLERDIRSSQ
jgi:hypothetical protein